MKPAIRWDSLSWPTGFHSGVRTWHCPIKWNDSRRLLKEHKMKSPQTTLKIHQPSPQSPHVWFLYPLWQIFVPRVSPMVPLWFPYGNVCWCLLSMCGPWHPVAIHSPTAVGSADRARRYFDAHRVVGVGPAEYTGAGLQLPGAWLRHPGPSRAIPGHPGPSRAIRLLLWCSFMLKTGKNLKNLVTWEVEEMWTLDNLEMILVGLNCLKFFLKSN